MEGEWVERHNLKQEEEEVDGHNWSSMAPQDLMEEVVEVEVRQDPEEVHNLLTEQVEDDELAE